VLSLILAWRNIWRNKRRTLITASSIVMAVVLTSFEQSLQQGQYDQMIQNTAGSFSGHLQIQAQGFRDEPTLDYSMPYSDSLMLALSQNPSVQAVIPRLDTYALAAGEFKSRASMVVGVDVVAEQLLSKPQQKLIEGRYFSSNEELGVLISQGLAEFLELEVADTLVLIGSGYQGMSATGAYPILGILKFGLPDFNRALIYMPIKEAQSFTGAYDRATSIAVLVHSINTSTQVSKALNQTLPAGFVALDWQEIMPDLVQAIEADFGSGFLVLLVLYMVVGFGILGTVMMMTAERTFELGIMTAIGTPRRRLAWVLTLEMFFISGLGALIGLTLSLPVIHYFHRFPIQFTGEVASMMLEYGMEPYVSLSTAAFIPLTQAGFIFGVSLLVSIYPAWHMRRFDTLKAMRG
jgi:ABC-type lipoprotein release transport system permease subunit